MDLRQPSTGSEVCKCCMQSGRMPRCSRRPHLRGAACACPRPRRQRPCRGLAAPRSPPPSAHAVSGGRGKCSSGAWEQSAWAGLRGTHPFLLLGQGLHTASEVACPARSLLEGALGRCLLDAHSHQLLLDCVPAQQRCRRFSGGTAHAALQIPRHPPLPCARRRCRPGRLVHAGRPGPVQSRPSGFNGVL